ncbi:MAG: nucleotidyltransferase family protein [Clostridia bacterium]|nr:nucleotidyltransferase family protein [Clostridia bacterium]
MKKIGIICEYNPFHGGHAYQIARIRAEAPDAAVVCLMSGHATQRGELAIADKFTRASMALSCGADVVLELPYPYCAASASYFAGAGVAILDALGMDELSFGSECADAALLEKAVDVTESEAFFESVRLRQKRGEGSAQGYFAELGMRMGVSEGFRSNDILALEYMRAIRAIESRMRPMPILRHGSDYTEQEILQDQLPSATAIRRLLAQGCINESLDIIPKSASKVLGIAIKAQKAPVLMSRLESAILAFFRLYDPAAYENIAEMQGGLSNRLHEAARASVTLEDFFAASASKSYTNARLRRAVLFAMTGVTVQDLKTPPAYLSLLAANEKGRVLLRQWKGTSPIPIFAKFADAPLVSPAAERQAKLALSLDALFSLALPVPTEADLWIKCPPHME